MSARRHIGSQSPEWIAQAKADRDADLQELHDQLEQKQHFCGACWKWGCISDTHTQEERDCSECGHELAIHLGDGCTLAFADGACNCKVRIS